MKVNIIDIKEINQESKRVKVFVNMKNIYGNYRTIEIGLFSFNELSLNKNKEIIVYEYKKRDYKINYEETFKLYNKKYIQFRK